MPKAKDFWKITWSKRRALVTLLAVGGAVSLVLLWMIAGSVPEDRVYRIGWESDPPFQITMPDGKPSGLAVEIIREAAARRGIRLRWLLRPESSEAALTSGAVELWPLMGITRERRRRFHFSDPYLQSEHLLVIRSNSPYLRAGDIGASTISYKHIPVDEKFLHGSFPRARLVAVESPLEAIQNVCQEQSDAAYLEEISVITGLLRGEACSGGSLRLLPIGPARPMLAIGARPEAREAADALREEIGRMAEEGRIGSIMASWGHVPLDRLQVLETTLKNRRQLRWLRVGVAFLVLLTAFSIWLAINYRRQRNRARAADRALEEAERELRLVANSLSELVLSYDMERSLVFANPAVERLTGYSPAEILERGFINWIHPDDQRRMLAHWERFYEGHAISEEEYRLITKDGQQKWVAATWGPIRDESGRQIGVIGSERDITEQKDAEARLRQSELRFRSLVEGLGEGFIEQNSGGLVTYCSPSAAAIIGRTVAEVVGRHYSEFVHPADLERVEQAAALSARGGTPQHLEYRLLAKTGRPKWVRASSAAILEGSRLRCVRALLIDITDMVDAQAEMRLLAEAVHQAAETIVVTDQNGSVQYVNPAFERVTGYSRAEALGKNPRLLKSGKHDEVFYKELWTTISAGKTWSGRIVNRKKDGALYTEECTVTPVRDHRGEIERYVAVKKDITRELELERQFSQAQRMESIGRLAGGIAHDFNNLLTVINGNTELALSQEPSGSQLSQRLNEVLSAGERAAELTRQLLTFSRQQPLQPEILDLNRLIQGSMRMLNRIVGEDIFIQCSLDDSIQPVLVDPGQMQQVILNLLVNARDAMPAGGRISINTSPASASDLPAGAVADSGPGTYTCLEIRDTGHGMDSDTRRRIFEPFFTTKDPGRGTGLGLSMVYGIVRQSGGWVSVESEPGQGASFTLLFPAVAAQPGVAPEASSAFLPAGGPETVLLVEDQSQVREFVAVVLRGQGYTVLDAPDARSALESARREASKIDALITDVIMPGMNGRDLALELRTLFPALKVLCITGYAEVPGVPEEALEKDFALLRKPFTPQSLLTKVRSLLDS